MEPRRGYFELIVMTTDGSRSGQVLERQHAQQTLEAWGYPKDLVEDVPCDERGWFALPDSGWQEETVELGTRERTLVTLRPLPKEDWRHSWWDPHDGGYHLLEPGVLCCRACGVVRPHDGRSDDRPCRGVVRVSLRR